MEGEVILSSAEIGTGVRIGGLRQHQALIKGKKEAHGYNGKDGWQIHIEGALGEIAAAKYLGVYWDMSVNTWKTEDLKGIHIRTRSEHNYDLIIRPNDTEDAIYVLVTGRYGQYRVRGWIEGSQTKNPKWLQTHGGRNPAFFVPQKVLNPMSLLKIKHLRS